MIRQLWNIQSIEQSKTDNIKKNDPIKAIKKANANLNISAPSESLQSLEIQASKEDSDSLESEGAVVVDKQPLVYDVNDVDKQYERKFKLKQSDLCHILTSIVQDKESEKL